MSSTAAPQSRFRSRRTPQSAVERPAFGRWFWSFLAEELTPYPGRAGIVARMIIAATLTMILIMTFRIPGAALAAYYTLVLSRESPTTTLQSAAAVLVSYIAGAAYILLGAILFVDYPLTHFLWVGISLFLCFFVIKVSTNFTAASAFAFVLTIAIPIWDQGRPTGQLVTTTLWAAASVSLGLAVTVVVEYVASLFEKRDELVSGLTNRLNAVIDYLDAEVRGGDLKAEKKIAQLAMVGVSRLRALATKGSVQQSDAAYRSTAISLVGRLVDICAAIPHSKSAQNTTPIAEEDRARLRAVANKLQAMKICLLARCSTSEPPEPHARPAQFPSLPELERTTELLALSLSDTFRDAAEQEQPPSGRVMSFVPDAFQNREHLYFALRGCLAAMLCYTVYTAIAWPGLSTSIATCVLTALSSAGVSRQRQLLRMAGAVVGGLCFGIGAQVYVIPWLDSLTGFTVLFVVVTFFSAWVATSTPRLAYFGLQSALAYDLIHLNEYYPQTNLAIARDRVMGVGLGLMAMWVVFDALGSAPAAEVMRDIFTKNLRLLAKLATPLREHPRVLPKSIQIMRDQISGNFTAVNAQADGVLFETGGERERHLWLRDQLLEWQPRLRALFLLQIAELHYRMDIVPEQLAPRILDAQKNFDERTAEVLTWLANLMAGSAQRRPEVGLRTAHAQLEQAIRSTYAQPVPRAEAVLALTSQITDILESLYPMVEEAMLTA